MTGSLPLREHGVYVHVPFCRRRCSYCDFYFEIGPTDPRFVDCLIAELQARKQELPATPATLSLGGGTPSRLSSSELQRLVQAVSNTCGLTTDAEVSLEVNPEDVDDDYVRGLRDAGFTRVSVGLQSFDDDVLGYLGRVHDGARGRAVVESLVRGGFYVGLDLIVGVPGEGQNRLQRDVDLAASLGAGHVSAYLLTVEEGTPLVKLIARGARAAVDDDAQAQAYEGVVDLLRQRGYRQYEISNHAREGQESRHNRIYWNRGDYLGLGPGAHSCRVGSDGRVRRRATTARLDGWLSAWQAGHDAAASEELLDEDAALREGIAFGLRDLITGVDLGALARLHRTRVPEDVKQALEAAVARGDAAWGTDGRLRLTGQGARFADRVARDVVRSP